MLNPEAVALSMTGAASQAAGAAWKSIKDVAAHEFQVLARRIVDIQIAVAAGSMKKSTASVLFQTAKSQLVAVLAMLSTMLVAGAKKVVNAALGVVKSAINTAVGFALIS